LKKLVRTFLLLFVALLIALAANTSRYRSRQLKVSPVAAVAIDEDGAVNRLALAIRIPTISYEETAKIQHEEFRKLLGHLQSNFPLVHQKLEPEHMGDHSLLYRWPGTDSKLKPCLLMAHMDVVPADPAEWRHPPFGGAVADGYVWGRGTLDDKSNVLAILESVEWLLAKNFTPARDIYLAFGHDEEIGGTAGAALIAKSLQTRKVQLEYVLDEGLLIVTDLLRDIDAPIAAIAIAEKGYVTLQLTVGGESGHSSIPPKHTAIGEMSLAIKALEDHPFDATLNPTTRAMLTYLGPEMPYSRKILLGNLWLFAPAAKSILLGMPQTEAMMRTTTAATVMHGGIKENVLPSSATALVNFRIAQGDSVKTVIEHVRRTIANDRIQISISNNYGTEPSPVSSIDTPAFQLLQRTISETNPGVVVAPSMMMGGTDSRHYNALTNNVYRFSPLKLSKDDLSRFHGANERISIQSYIEMIRFYIRLIQNSSALR
jgi:carboxypeptidase PM20D1